MRGNLDTAIQAIHVRFGEQSLQRAVRLPATSPWPSGVEAVDRLSGIGGLPRGRLSVLTGSGSCGKLSLALGLLAGASHEFAQVLVVDPEGCFDGWSLAPFGADLSALTVVRPPDLAACGEAAVALARAGAGFLLLLSSPGEAFAGIVSGAPAKSPDFAGIDLSSLEAASARSGTLVLAVVERPSQPLAYASSLTLDMHREDWVWDRGQLVGLKARLRTVKNKLAPPVGEASLEVRYPLGAQLFFSEPVRVPAALGEEAVACQVRSAAG